jgi:cytidine deaminase
MMMPTNQQILPLIQKATQAMAFGFVPLGESKVGACVLTSTGESFEGCNIGSVISGLGVCAERAAIDHAVVHGQYEFEALVVVREDGANPCGACLQYLMQFYAINEKDIIIVAANTKGEFQIHTLFELLPFGYVSEKNKGKIKAYKK